MSELGEGGILQRTSNKVPQSVGGENRPSHSRCSCCPRAVCAESRDRDDGFDSHVSRFIWRAFWEMWPNREKVEEKMQKEH